MTAAVAPRKFKVTYVNGLGERVMEEPRLLITADGCAKSLVIGTHHVLATVTMEHSDAELWMLARGKAYGMARTATSV